MNLKWRRTHTDSWQLWWDDERIRCAELTVRGSDWRWALTLSYRVAPMDFVPDRTGFDSLEEAKEYTENLVRILIIGGHHERN
jgi:hypothetical protein